MAITKTAIGKVIPSYRSDWDETIQYYQLDNVFCDNGCTYVAVASSLGAYPPANPQYWQIIASKGGKGDTGSFGEPTAVAVELQHGEPAYASVTADPESPDTAKIFNFEFGLPAGPFGFDIVTGKANSVASDQPLELIPTLRINSDKAGCVSWPTAIDLTFDQAAFASYATEYHLPQGEYDFSYNASDASWYLDSSAVDLDSYGISYTIASGASLTDGDVIELIYGGRDLNFELNVPEATGENVQSVDGIQPVTDQTTNLKNVKLFAVRAVENQGLSDLQKSYARSNINAQVAGNYQPAGNYIVSPANPSDSQFLYYNETAGTWSAQTITLVPAPAPEDRLKYLRIASNNQLVWAEVQSLPAGGAIDAPLVKLSGTNYHVGWGSLITTAEIDEMMA